MTFDDFEEVLKEARQQFNSNSYGSAEPLLNQLILRSYKSAEVFHMLGVIFYDQGKFNKAIRSFQRALEIDPAFTDSSVGLSIILNDLGRYEEGRKVFEGARNILSERSSSDDPHMNEKLSHKHDELGEMYLRYQRPNEALEQYEAARRLSTRKAELSMKIVRCWIELGNSMQASKELRALIVEFPQFLPARVQLGRLHYDAGQVTEAIEAWEEVLAREPDHTEAKQLIQKADALDYTNLTEVQL